MKFEETSLTGYLVKNLESLTEADPVILAEYVAALLKKDKPIAELQKLCAEKLVEFLGQGTSSFITKLFQALEDGSVVAPAKTFDATGQVETSPSLITEDPAQVNNSSLNPEDPGCASDQEEKEVSDDDDDDRNHKHRRRETQSESFDKDVPGQFIRRTNRKRSKPFQNGQVFFGNDPQSSENQKEYNPASLERDLSARVDKRRPVLGPVSRPAYDLGIRTRVNQAFHGDPGPQFDMSASLGRLPTGRGRGRGSGFWNQHDLKFNSMDTLDFALQMPPQGPTHANLFAGRGLQPFGMIPGMPNGGLNALHPLGLQRCRDFEERGFCLRGDMCPMEHGVNRIVVEDVQSLSQFNLPVSLPTANILGTTPGAGPLHLGGVPSSLQANNKSLHSKNNKHGTSDSSYTLNKVSSASAGAGEADLYDPDQPLWNNAHLSSTKADDAALWNGDPTDSHGFGLSDGFEGEQPGNTSSSVWGRIRNSGNKLGDATVASMGGLRNEIKDQQEALSSIPSTTHPRKRFKSEDAGSKAMTYAAKPRLQSEPARKTGRTSQKALRTLFVNGIPLNNNKKEALLSHFRKFGQIVDIYIPLNSEKAFVQFSKRDEAEAALKAPDAVMGNRFIKLWWANRDSIGDTVSAVSQGVTASVSPHPTVDGNKENHSSTILKVSTALVSDPVSKALVIPSVTNGPKIAPSPQKKLDNLELLKEEIRLKQEILDKKRNDFRRQLDRLEKQAITKGEATADRASKKHKVGMGMDFVKTSTLGPISSNTSGHRIGAEKTGGRSHPEESTVSPNSKMSSTPMPLSPKSLKHPGRPSVQLGTISVANRFKLDNRPTAFKILPPLPADFADVGILKEHFSPYGDISAVELEDLEADSAATCSELSGNRTARITFTTRRSAEMAFFNGKLWKDYNLKFSWVVVPSNSSNSHSGRDNSPTPTTKSTPDAEVLADTTSSGSLSIMGETTSTVSQVAASVANGEPENSKATNNAIEPMDLLELCQSRRTHLSPCETLSPKGGTRILENGTDAGNVQ